MPSYCVYELTDPRCGMEVLPGAFVYVGITERIRFRYRQHLQVLQNAGSARIAKDYWIIYLDQVYHLLPAISIREICADRLQAAQQEAYWIRFHQQRGAVVLNERKRTEQQDTGKPLLSKAELARLSDEERLVYFNNEPVIALLLHWSRQSGH